MNTKIAIVDSGINYCHSKMRNLKLCHSYNVIGNCTEVNDNVGHGTAVVGIIQTINANVDISIIKIYEYELSTNIDTLLAALHYIWEKIDCDILHLSLGVSYYNQDLYNLCKAFYKKGTIIVSAYNNDGSISYPAAFDCVLGVEGKKQCTKGSDFFLPDKDDIVDIYAKGGFHRVAWTKPEYVIQQGNSMSAAYVTGYLSKYYERGINNESVVQILKNISTFIPYTINNPTALSSLNKDNSEINIKRAGLFPFNKEMMAIINYADLLSFEVSGIYSCKYLGNLKKRVCGIYGGRTYEIKNVEDINFQDIDTLIIGHLVELEELTHIKYKEKLLQACLENRKNAFLFDSYELGDFPTLFRKNNLKLYIPDNYEKRDKNRNGKLYQVSSPVLGIFGTSSKQGKFTLQLQLRKIFIHKGYKIAQLATEPNALLFGIDNCIPFGYSSRINLDQYEFISYLNGVMHQLDVKSPDLIITGSQSGTIPEDYLHLGHLPIRQLEFLIGTIPDAVILCVNCNDDVQYIKKTIDVIEGLGDTSVIALAICPFYNRNGWDYATNNSAFLSNEQVERVKWFFYEKLNLPNYVIGDASDGEKLADIIIDYFADEEIDDGEI